MENQDFLIEALNESIDTLCEDVIRLRDVNCMLRRVNSSLRGQLKNAQANDEEFKSYEHEGIEGYIAVEVDYQDNDQSELGSRT